MQNHIVIVTGGAGGLGTGVCRVFAEAGATVIIADRHESMLADGKQFHARKLDLLDEASVAALMQETAAQFGRLDSVVNLAGGFVPGKVADTELEALDKMFALNIRPVFAACKHAVRVMRAHKRGSIVNVGARPAVHPVAGLAAYGATKAGVVHLSQTLALESAADGIRVNVVLPSVIDTPANRKDMPDADFSRWVTPESMGRVIRFLCSDEAADVTGAVVPVYGRA